MSPRQASESIIVGPGRIGELTTRERFRRVMHYQAVDRIPHMEFGYWDSLKDRWMAEGHLPAVLRRHANGVIRDDEVERFFGCEQRTGAGPAIDAGPHRPVEIVEEREGKVIYRDGLGILCEEVQEGIRSIPHFLEFPIRDRPTWKAFRDEFLDLDADWRAKPDEWIEARARELQRSELPVGTHFGSFIGRIRDWMGFQSLAYLYLAANYCRFDYLAAIRLAASYVRHLHGSDNYGRLGGVFDDLGMRVPYGDGDVHMPHGWGSLPHADALRALPDYRGLYVMEIRPRFRDHFPQALAMLRDIVADLSRP